METAESNVHVNADVIRQKLGITVTALQVTGIAYVAWIFWLILAPLTRPESLVNWLRIAFHRPLTNVDTWQFGAYFLVDLLNWLLIAVAASYCWSAMQQIKTADGNDKVASSRLVVGAWLACIAEAISILARPLKSYVMTVNDNGEGPLFHWYFSPQDLVVSMLCLALLGFAYVFSWKAYLAEENKGFI